MKIGSHDTNDFSPLTKLLLVIGAILFVSLPYVTQQVRGLTQIGTVIATNPNLETDLTWHYTFDAGYVDKSNTSAEITERTTGNTADWLNHASTTVPGKIGQAIWFDGSNDYVREGDKFSTSQEGIIAGWIKVEKTANQTMVSFGSWSDGDNIQCGVRNVSGTMYVYVGRNAAANSVRGDTPILVDEWHHIACASDGTSWSLYVDGVEQSLSTIAGSNTGDWWGDVTQSGTDYSYIGVELRWGALSEYTQGIIDDVRIYDSFIGAENIQRLYELGATTKISTTINSNPDLKDGLVGHWTFDGKYMINNVADSSGNGNVGYLRGQTSTTTIIGRLGQAIELEYSNDWIEVLDSSSLDGATGPGQERTVAFWIKATGVTSNKVITDKANFNGNNLWTETQDSGAGYTIEGGVAVTGSLTSGTLDKNRWYHVVWTYDGSNSSLFIDSVLVDGPQAQTAPAANDNSFIIGGFGNGSFDMEGSLDDVRIYNRALSANDIARLYELGATTKIAKTITSNPALQNGLVGHWTFDSTNIDTASTTAEILDSSTNGNRGDWISHSSTTKPGKLGQAIEFDGVDDYIQIPDDNTLDVASAFTIATWLKSDTNGLYEIAVKGTTGFEFDHSGGNLRINDNGVKVLQTLSYPQDSEWHHVAATWDDAADTTKLCIDGVCIAEGGETETLTNNADNIVIGEESGSKIFDGSMDDFRIYNRALSADEIRRLYELGQ